MRCNLIVRGIRHWKIENYDRPREGTIAVEAKGVWTGIGTRFEVKADRLELRLELETIESRERY